MTIDPRLHRIVAAQPYPLLFATISGAHLYGFPSPDSDYDLRGAHVLPLAAVVGLEVRDETVQQEMIVLADTSSGLRSKVISPDNPHPAAPPSPAPAGEGQCGAGALEMDIVSHDVKKFFGLLLKKNGYVLEQLYSPLIVHTTPEHAELKAASAGAITKHHSHHYFGFAETQWKLFLKGEAEDETVGTSCRSSHTEAAQQRTPYQRPRRVKPLLYVYRVLLTGIHLMRTGVVNANLVELNAEARLPYIADLIARKQSGENTTLEDVDVAFHQSEYESLRTALQKAHDESQLPEVPSEETRKALNDLLVRVRLKTK
jgi:predicted nucleotidyltransferase